MKIARFKFEEANHPVPDHKEGVVYVDKVWQACTLLCPCGCNAVISLSLLPNTKPKWSVNGDTLTPSVNRTVGCKSHFSITNGIVTDYNNI